MVSHAVPVSRLSSGEFNLAPFPALDRQTRCRRAVILWLAHRSEGIKPRGRLARCIR